VWGFQMAVTVTVRFSWGRLGLVGKAEQRKGFVDAVAKKRR